MKILTSFDALQNDHASYAWTIGMFDGVHRGHHTLFNALRKRALPMAVLTFSTHLPNKTPPLITPLETKLRLLEAAGFAIALLLPFSTELANMPFDECLERLQPAALVLGVGASFGKGREGTEERVRAWAEPKGVAVEYVKKESGVSSQRIREAIAQKDQQLIENLLGRAYV